MFAIDPLDSLDRDSCIVGVGHHFRFRTVVFFQRSAVSPVPFALHRDELVAKVLNRLREGPEVLLAGTSFSGLSVIERSICLSPSSSAATGTFPAYESVRATSCKAVEHRVKNCASGSVQIRLPRSASACTHQIGGCFDKVIRSQAVDS